MTIYPSNCYQVKDIESIVEKEKSTIKQTTRKNKHYSYINYPFSFDIESSSFYFHDDKRVCMYAFVFCIGENIIIGRTWEEFLIIIDKLTELLEISLEKRLIVYVHNLGYEFQFIRKMFNWNKVFCREPRSPIYALTEDGIEFRCSYQLSGYSLQKVGENLLEHNIEKKVGDLDYSLLRHSQTPLSSEEWGYIINDGLIVIYRIEEEIKANKGKISSIPLTKTGKVRRYCKNKCFYEFASHKKGGFRFIDYHKLTKQLTITSVAEYMELKEAFQGGFTHANANYVNKKMYNVHSFDFTSSYPAVMISEKFPMSRGELIKELDKDKFEFYINHYCCIFVAMFTDLYPKARYENYISSSRCKSIINGLYNNGRVVEADELTITITEVDYELIKEYYTWGTFKVKNFRIYKKGYLPKNFVESILDLYANKTQLKGVLEKIVEYQNSKENLNSCYGMTVTDIVKPEITYENDEWGQEEPNFETVLEKYNKDISRFLYYPWGIYVTAYARRNLFTAISELKDDYIYSDTDSVKFINYDKHKDYFERYNANMKKKIILALTKAKIDISKAFPKTIKGEVKALGYWDSDGDYKIFKTLGAKRYLTLSEDNKISLTVSGLNKTQTLPYLLNKFKIPYNYNKEKDTFTVLDTTDIEKVFDYFKEGLYIPRGHTGKNTHTYIDDVIEGDVVDYLGNKGHYKELSSVHIEEADYSLSFAENFVKYLMGIRERSI